MTLRLDPRRLRALKELAGEAGLRPGDLARQWVEERIDAARIGPGGVSLEDRIAALEGRVRALEGDEAPPRDADESAVRSETRAGQQAVEREAAGQPPVDQEASVDREGERPGGTQPMAATAPAPPAPEPAAPEAVSSDAASQNGPPSPTTRRRGRVTAAPAAKVALHDEMIAVLAERGPMTAGELAAAIVERGRYAPPRSGKALDASMVSQRASNPTYRARFVRREGKIGLAETT